MGLFDRFKKQVPETSPAYERLLKAKEAFDKGEYRECLGMIIEAFDQDVDYMPLYRLSADCLAKSGGQEEQVLFEQVLSQPDNFETYRQLGAHFFENGHARMAKPFLRKALSLQPTDVYTAHLLAISYARNFEMEQALSTLENIDLQKDFWAVHFLNKCRLESMPLYAGIISWWKARYLEVTSVIKVLCLIFMHPLKIDSLNGSCHVKDIEAFLPYYRPYFSGSCHEGFPAYVHETTRQGFP